MAREILPSYLPAAKVTFVSKDGGDEKIVYRPYQALKTDDLKAAPDDTGALLELGRRYFFGWGDVKQDYETAFTYLRQAGDRGAQDALTLLAGYYILDEITVRENDNEKALTLLNAAAEGGAWDAMEKLSELYRGVREDIPADLDKAYEWAENAEQAVRVYWQFYTQPGFVDFMPTLEAILHGHTRITMMLAGYCANGIGTKRDLNAAKRWLDIGEAFVCSATGLAEVPMFQFKRKELDERVRKDAERAKKKK
ncbi:MAG: sel1 repeat family protein [Oscillospiraceae bacterium]|nr:sel1 repeat family protein [Oscillospiraceae bacterium]